MLKRFLSSIRSQKNLARSCSFALLFFMTGSTAVADPRIERDFLRLPDNRWVWLKKIDWEKTQMIVGKGPFSKKQIIWSKDFESDDERSWAYAYFVFLKPRRLLLDLDQDGNPEIGVATYDFGNNMIRKILIFSVYKDRVVFLREHGPINLAADESVFK